MSGARAVEGKLVERRGSPGVTVDGQGLEKVAGVGGGAFKGADQLGKELASWRPPSSSADNALNPDKMVLDSRGRDLIRNSGQMLGANNVHQDSIVGSQYRLNLNPAYAALRRATGDTRFDETWAEEFQEEVEELFTLYAESDDNWVDTTRNNTFTGLIRMAIGCYFAGGEVLMTSNWMREPGRPFATAFQLVDCDRLSNPNGESDNKFLRRGVVLNANGAQTHVWIRGAHPNDFTQYESVYTWTKREMRQKWGRLHTLYLARTQRPEQTRGVADMVSVLKQARMADRFNDVTLSNAIVNASFAATIESELPPEMAFEMLGGSNQALTSGEANLSYLQAIAEYSRGGQNIEIDGSKIPYLFPGSKLRMTPAGTVGGIGTGFEESLHRNISAGLGISYEEYTHDFTKTNYSSARAAANNTLRAMSARKREVADRTANGIFRNVFEEMMDRGLLTTLNPMLKRNKDLFYENLNKDALCRASWIGSSRGQVDEMKETQAAVLRINSGLSTYEIECAKLGSDFRDIYKQQIREKRLRDKAGLVFNTAPSKSGTLSAQPDNAAGDNGKSNSGESDGDGFDD